MKAPVRAVLLLVAVAHSGGPAWGQDCARAQADYGRAVRVLYHPAPGNYGPVPDQQSIAARASLIQAQLSREIASQLGSGPTASAAPRLRAWLKCVQKGYASPQSTNAPAVTALNTPQPEILVTEWIPLYWPQVRAYVQIWKQGNGGWYATEWRNSELQNADYWVRPIRRFQAGESRFLEWGYTIGNGDFLLHMDIVAWNGHEFRQVWSAPNPGVYQTFMESAADDQVVIRSVFGSYKKTYHELLRTLVMTRDGLVETGARFVYYPSRPAGAPVTPHQLVPLSEPGPRGFPSHAY